MREIEVDLNWASSSVWLNGLTVKSKSDWFGVWVIHPYRVTYLLVNYWYSALPS